MNVQPNDCGHVPAGVLGESVPLLGIDAASSVDDRIIDQPFALADACAASGVVAPDLFTLGYIASTIDGPLGITFPGAPVFTLN